MTDDDPPTLTTRQDGSGVAVSMDAVATFVHTFAAMLSSTEARLSEQLRENATTARERWQTWEREFERYRDQTERRLTSLEGSVHEHHSQEERRQIAYQARVRPVQRILGWVWDNRRDLLLVLIGAIALATLWIDFLSHAFGTPR